MCKKLKNGKENQWVWGFHASNFFLRDETNETNVFFIDCGGSHRPWAFSMEMDIQSFASYRANQLYIYSTALNLLQRNSVLQNGLHGREIRAMDFNPSGDLLLSGSEDTKVTLLEFQSNGNIIPLNSVKFHNSGIQSLTWFSDDILFSTGGLEELNVYRLIQKPEAYLKRIVHEKLCKPNKSNKTYDGDLRITDISVVKATHLGERVLWINTVQSDSTIKAFTYNVDTKQLNCIKSWKYKTVCLVFAEAVIFGSHLLLVVASTDGNVAIWNTFWRDPQIEPLIIWIKTVHQFCVKSLNISRDQDVLTISTGGDDGAISRSILLLEQISENSVVVNSLHNYFFAEAHASSVTGVLSITKELLLSVSIDQRILLWKVEGDSLKPILERYTHVADVGGMIRNNDFLIIYGIGCEVFRLGSLR